jgi:two-component system, LytTR family, response regulator LytT
MCAKNQTFAGLPPETGLPAAPSKKITTLLITHKNKIIPVKISAIAFFCIIHKLPHLVTFDGRRFCTPHSLEELETICGSGFFRANRQCLVNREAITEVQYGLARKLVLPLKVEGVDDIIIGKHRAREFLQWLSG